MNDGKLKKIFIKYNVSLAYQFGSTVKGMSNNSSDVDVALYFDKEPRRMSDLLDLRHKLSEVFKTEKLDLTILNSAPFLLKHEIATKGKLLYENKEGLDREFSKRALQTYEDCKYFDDVYFSSFKDRVSYV